MDAAENDGNAHKDKQPEEKDQKAEDVSLNSDDREMPDIDPAKENHDSVSEEKQPDIEREKGSSKSVATENSGKPADIISPSVDKCSAKELKEPLKDGNKLCSENKDASQATVSQSAVDASQPEASKDVEMKDALQSEKDTQDIVKTAGEEVEQAKEVAKGDLITRDTSVAQQPIGLASVPENGTAECLYLSISDTVETE